MCLSSPKAPALPSRTAATPPKPVETITKIRPSQAKVKRTKLRAENNDLLTSLKIPLLTPRA